MIFNMSTDAGKKVYDFITLSQYDTFVTDAVHIYWYYNMTTNGSIAQTPFVNAANVWLIWKPGDPVEIDSEIYTSTSSTQTETYKPIRATSTLTLDPYCLTNATNVYIPYATSIYTFNYDYQRTSDGSADNLVYTQQCFSSTATIHVNSTLKAYMDANPSIWGNISSHIIADL